MSQRLNALVGELMSDPGFTTGERAFPRALPVADGIALVAVMHAETDRWTAVRARVAEESGMGLACGRGCAGCCETVVVTSLPEALAVAAWLSLPEQEAARKRFLATFPPWFAAVGDAAEVLARLTDHSADRERYEAAHIDQWRRRIPCAFNQEGDCTIYPVRPVVCREAHAVRTNEHCFGERGDTIPPGRLKFGPLDDVLRRCHVLLQATHNALTDEKNRYASLCVAVYRLLETPERHHSQPPLNPPAGGSPNQ